MTPAIRGADTLVAWFGSWPSFHDAEILELHLDRSGPCWLKVHAWRMTDKVGEDGYYVLNKHVVVTFHMTDILRLSLEGFSGQNVIFGLAIESDEEGFTINLEPCFGLYGYLTAGEMTVELTPGKPDGSTMP